MLEHILISLSLVFGLYMAWNIGANDVANAFGCSVGSGALTFRRAIVLAAIFEFSGAFFAGSHVADTIRGDIVVADLFTASPTDFALGMLASLLAASLWLNVATYLGQPVSTTHAIIGAVMGFGVAAHGLGCVQWHKFGRIAASWIVSPVVGAVASFVVYRLIRRFVLRFQHPVVRARVAVPLALAAVTWVLAYATLSELLGRMLRTSQSWQRLALPGALLAAGVAAGVGRVLMRRVGTVPDAAADEHEVVERCYARLQILTACYVSFAHGANDVANAIAPIAGLLQAVGGQIGLKVTVPAWLLAFGGVGIVAGLATYGYKVIQAVGFKITEVTPTRGFSADFSTASTVLVCSLMGLPISTTFVLVGAVMGVGLARGFSAVDLAVVRRIFMSWLVTIPLSAVGAAVLYWLLRVLVAV